MVDATLAAIAQPAQTDPEAAQRARRQPLARRRYALEIRQHMGWRRQVLILAAALLAGLAISAAILVAAGVPARVLKARDAAWLTVDTHFARAAVDFQPAEAQQVGGSAGRAPQDGAQPRQQLARLEGFG